MPRWWSARFPPPDSSRRSRVSSRFSARNLRPPRRWWWWTTTTPCLADLRARLPDAVEIVANPDARGLSSARNTAIARSRGDYIVFIDDDAVAHDQWLARLLFAFRDPTVIGAGGHARPLWAQPPPHGSLPSSCGSWGAPTRGFPRPGPCAILWAATWRSGRTCSVPQACSIPRSAVSAAFPSAVRRPSCAFVPHGRYRTPRSSWSPAPRSTITCPAPVRPSATCCAAASSRGSPRPSCAAWEISGRSTPSVRTCARPCHRG